MERRQINAIITVLAALAAAGAIAVGITALTYEGADGEHPQGGIRVSGDFHWAIPDAGEAARRADLVARAAVIQRLPPFWSTPDRKRPNLSDNRLALSPHYRIYTPYRIRIKSVLKGDAQGNEDITLNRLGGRIGNDIVEVGDDAFSFTPGTEAVLFLRDCGQRRADEFKDQSARFRIIDRYQLDESGEPIDTSVSYEDLVGIVKSEGTMEPMRETPC